MILKMAKNASKKYTKFLEQGNNEEFRSLHFVTCHS